MLLIGHGLFSNPPQVCQDMIGQNIRLIIHLENLFEHIPIPVCKRLPYFLKHGLHDLTHVTEFKPHPIQRQTRGFYEDLVQKFGFYNLPYRLTTVTLLA
jgi:hypothetical protein